MVLIWKVHSIHLRCTQMLGRCLLGAEPAHRCFSICILWRNKDLGKVAEPSCSARLTGLSLDRGTRLHHLTAAPVMVWVTTVCLLIASQYTAGASSSSVCWACSSGTYGSSSGALRDVLGYFRQVEGSVAAHVRLSHNPMQETLRQVPCASGSEYSQITG